ncbi:glycosyl hydrolase family 61-domain-containing protein [Lasiosphaeria miniovina]|uniref:lytic cellulose monooxygenase (C4-dehydrogenating) n=1 Tax=Lasiosphaeria miniovina TaxID=1954250 RepID=A0AA40AK18_9PEZI|nr:glycosyl hydrolase family 61-domain-containing protein [Lasiosphaeria miniovina]KAK0717308.1 glycosyl hydrolase family 61-domain-containing protein [Lasiosphaeria miniovina]
MRSRGLFSACAVAVSGIEAVTAHTFIWGVFVNGVDQGTYRAIRTPAYNNPPPRGYANSPVKDLDSIDMRCNVLGDKQVPYTIKVAPGDNLTFDWHHNNRTDADDVIADSHHGPALVYLSPDPPTDNSFVKIWEEGLYEQGTTPFTPGKWATTADIAANHGHMNVRIPAGLKAGHYLIRAEMIGLHEADANYQKVPFRGAQFYPNCVQIEVVGDGAVELPEGVSFPGAYKYSDPGVVYDIYCSTKTTLTTPCATTTYQIPVWSGAWAETTAVPLGPISGVSTATLWSSWIVKSVVTSATYVGNVPHVVATSTYEASWSAHYVAPTAVAV